MSLIREENKKVAIKQKAIRTNDHLWITMLQTTDKSA